MKGSCCRQQEEERRGCCWEEEKESRTSSVTLSLFSPLSITAGCSKLVFLGGDNLGSAQAIDAMYESMMLRCVHQFLVYQSATVSI